jgi:hypothetical protein
MKWAITAQHNRECLVVGGIFFVATAHRPAAVTALRLAKLYQ